MNLPLKVRVARKKRNAAGWHLVIGPARFWFKHKPQAIREARRLIAAMVFSIEPVQRPKPRTESEWLND
jgi:hypothetical protein